MVKKIRLSLFGFLVSGFVAVSAIGGLSLAKTAYADDVATVGKFVMKDGGSVRMAQDESDKTGIRWSAIIDQDFYNSLNVGEQAVEFGAVVTPARNLSEGELLTVDSKQAMTVSCSATEPKFNSEGEFIYSASIVYDDLEEAQKQDAYALELVARAYVKVGETYNYVESYSTTRSMRAIALAAVQSGAYAEETLNGYYGKKTVNKATENTGYYGNEDAGSVFENKHNISGEIQAYIGAKPVSATIADGKIVVSNAGDLVEQKSYTLNVFDAKGNVFSQPFVAATKVIRTAADLAYFELKDITKVQGKSIVSSTRFDGYYVVANDIDATGYSHKAIKSDEESYKLTYEVDTNGEIPTKEGSSEYQKTVDNNLYKVDEVGKYTDRAIRGGLEGTFDGAGHTISNLTVINQGLFGLVTSGTVKNVGFTSVNLKSSESGMNTCLFAQNVSDGRFENVYVQANDMWGGRTWENDDAGGNRALIATQLDGFYCKAAASDTGKDRWAKTTFTDCVFEYTIKNAKARYCYSYGLYAADASFVWDSDDKDDDKSPDFSNVYVIANTTISVRNPGLVVWGSSKVILAENEATEETKLEKAKALIESEGMFNSENDKNNFRVAQVKVTTGIKRYTTAELMKAAGNNYGSFNLAYWSVLDGVLSWKKA